MTRLTILCLSLLLTACMAPTMPEPPRPPAMIEDYTGMERTELLRVLGQPDLISSTDGEDHLLYHWHTRDAVLAPRAESAWRGNVGFIQRQLPTQNIPPRDTCDIVFVTDGDHVTRVDKKGLCW